MDFYSKLLALCYLFGAAIHGGNMFGLGELPWFAAPLGWRIADIVYLILDIFVVVGLWQCTVWGARCFLLAAFSQLFLYGFYGDYFVIDDTHRQAVNLMIVFHFITVSLYAVLYYFFVYQVKDNENNSQQNGGQ